MDVGESRKRPVDAIEDALKRARQERESNLENGFVFLLQKGNRNEISLQQLSEEEKATIVPARPEKLSSGSRLRRTRARQIVFVGY